MPLYAVIDTNVLVSAFLKMNSVPRAVIEYVFAGDIVPIFNREIIEEYKTVLNRSKFHFPPQAVDLTINRLEGIGINIEKADISDYIPDHKDIVFYAVTMGARLDIDAFLVTGNIKHFPTKPFVVTPRQMLDIVENNCVTPESSTS